MVYTICAGWEWLQSIPIFLVKWVHGDRLNGINKDWHEKGSKVVLALDG